MTNLRYALRSLGNARGFTAAAVLTLALGIGANATAFSVVDALMLRPLPVEDPGALVRLHPMTRNVETGEVSRGYSWAIPDFEDYRARREVFAGLAAQEGRGYRVGAGAIEEVPGAAVSGDYFGVLGVKAIRGRPLLPSDDAAGSPAAVAVVSESYWRSRMGADPRALGKTILLDGHPFRVVGVVGAERVFRALGGENPAEVWIPLRARAAFLDRTANPLDSRSVSFARVFGRLQPGVTVERAQLAADLTARRLAAAYPRTNADRLARVAPAGNMAGLALDEDTRASQARAAYLLMAVVAMVLLIACANVANLLLARATARRREIAIRSALGAGRGHIARQLLTESVVLALMGGAAGLILARLGVSLAARIPDVARVSPTLDARVVAFTLVVSVLAGIAFGLVPVVGAGARDLLTSLRDGGAQGATRGTVLQGALVVGQVSITLVLVVAMGLVLRSLGKLHQVDPGFHAEKLLTAGVNFAEPGSRSFAPPPAARVQEVLDRVRALPGVEAATFATMAPLSGMSMSSTFEVPGYTPPPGEEPSAGIMAIDGEYLGTLGIPVLRGQGFGADAAADDRRVLVNRALAAKYWPGRDAVGQRIRSGDEVFQVAGVVGDVRAAEIAAEASPTLYYRSPRQTYSYLTLHVRAAGDPAALVLPLGRVLARATPGQPAPTVKPMSESVSDSLAQARWIATFFTLFGGVALTLAAVGLYGVVSYSVTQRRREIGIRSALGAGPRRLVAMMLRQGGALAALGAALGIGLAVATTRAIGSVLYEVEPLDTASFALAVTILAGAALLASWLPARRAARVDPMVALRSE
ncbi:MAG TPA: ABC transporter permease [Longimicrobium sp.]|jgi:predicted permease